MPIYQPEGISKRIWADDQDALVQSVGSMLALNTLYTEGSMIKEAASAAFSRAELNDLKPPKGNFMVHQIGIGAHEKYGWNRNGDAFFKEALVKYHPTFVTKARMYREHRNYDPNLAVGIVKAAKYNYEMDRTEQVLWGEINKCPDVYEMAKQGKETSYSMACMVPFDICNVCGNRAKNVANYCDDLKKNMGGYDERHKKYAFAINEKPEFNDMSEVRRPADRTAWSLSYGFNAGDELMKAASASMYQAAGSSLHLPIPTQRLDTGFKSLLKKLANYETACRNAVASGSFNGPEWQKRIWDHADLRGSLTIFEPGDFGKVAALRPATLFKLLAKKACILDLPELISLFEGSHISKTACDCHVVGAKPFMADVFDMMNDIAEKEEPLPFLPSFMPAAYSEDRDPAYDNQIDNLMDLAERNFSCGKTTPPSATTITIIIKRGSASGSIPAARSRQSADMAMIYGIYKLAALRSIIQARPDLNEDVLTFIAAAQNLQPYRTNAPMA